MPRRELPDRMPDADELRSGRIGVENDEVCKCGHGLCSHNEAEACLICGCQKFEER